jgi:hypothetical protein
VSSQALGKIRSNLTTPVENLGGEALVAHDWPDVLVAQTAVLHKGLQRLVGRHDGQWIVLGLEVLDHDGQQFGEIITLMEMRDEDIDLSDIPEIREIPKDTVRGFFYRGRTIDLTPELHRYFRDLAEWKRRPLNDLVNETLAKAVEVAEVAR